MKYLGVLALAALFLPVAAGAQDSATIPNPITSLLKQQVVRYGNYKSREPKPCPADKYIYQSTRETRTFAQLILHVAQFNNNMCARISGMTAPDIKGFEGHRRQRQVSGSREGLIRFLHHRTQWSG